MSAPAVTHESEAAIEPEAGIETPTVRRAARRAWPWLALVALVVIVAVVLLVLSLRPQSSGAALAADNPGPNGAQALARVLEQHGVDVTRTHTLNATEKAVRDPDDTTVLVYDPDELLSSDQHERLRAAAHELVLVAPSFATLGDLAPGVSVAGRTQALLHADCPIGAVRRAGTVAGGAALYDAEGSDGAISCLRTAHGAALVQLPDTDVRVTVLGAAAALQNDTITRDGDAALALNLLGRHAHLVWYLPGPDDLDGSGPTTTLAELTPPWVLPFVLLLLAGVLAAAFWRGRRMGRVVVENLPVEVRSSETMEGRARLYERANARVHALDALRIGTTTRLAGMLGLPRSASVDEIADAAAAALGRPRAEVVGILIDTLPEGDADLVALSDALARLERDTARAVRP